MILVLNLVSVGMWCLGSGAFWIWHHRWKTAKWIAILFWRGVTLLSIGYLVYDRVYEADATLSASASDPTFAFAFPFTITNNSHIFVIRNVRWSCQALHIKWGNNNRIENSQIISGSRSEIAAGQPLNIDCSIVGPNSRFVHTDAGIKVDQATIRIVLEYDADFLFFRLHRTPPPTLFTWWGSASNPQWIKGNPAQ